MMKPGTRTHKGWRRDKAIVEFIEAYRERTGNGPSVDEIADHIKVSFQAANLRINGLINRGELGCVRASGGRRRPNSLYVIENRYAGISNNGS